MILAGGLAILTAIGALQVLGGWVAVARYARRAAPPPGPMPPITVLKPLHGDEPLLEMALASLCEQDYPPGFQVVFGVSDATDTAIPVVRALQARYPDSWLDLVVGPTDHGTNPKVGNLINMMSVAKHDVLVIADSDVHARPDYLRNLAAVLTAPGVGLVTTLYIGLPAFSALPAQLGAMQITYGFLPGALLGRVFGRGDCLGATMCLTRQTLIEVGGFAALKDHLADDNVLGQLVLATGRDVVLADTVVATTVPECAFPALWRHELRWARTIRALTRTAFAAAVLQYPLFFATLTIIASPGTLWSWSLFLLVWGLRALAAAGIDRALAPKLGGLAFRGALWLLPLRDLLSAIEWMVSHVGRRVDWRGETLEADTPARIVPATSKGSHVG
jgi:ceramide glucosyltransferase